MRQLEGKIGRLIGLKGFRFVIKEGTGDVEVDDSSTIDCGSHKCPPLTGDQCTTILKCIDTLLDHVMFDQLVKKIWMLWAAIVFGYLEGTTEKLRTRSLDQLQQLLQQLGHSISDRWPEKGVGWYLHILIHHLPMLLRNYRSLCPFST